MGRKRQETATVHMFSTRHLMCTTVLSSRDEQCDSTLQMGKPKLKGGQLSDSPACTLHLYPRRAATEPPPCDKSLERRWDAKQGKLQRNSTGAFARNVQRLAGWEVIRLQKNWHRLNDIKNSLLSPSPCSQPADHMRLAPRPCTSPSSSPSRYCLCATLSLVCLQLEHMYFFHLSKWDHVSSALNWGQRSSCEFFFSTGPEKSSVIIVILRANTQLLPCARHCYEPLEWFMRPQVAIGEPIIVILILQRRQERHREVKWFCQGHTGSKEWR